MGEVGCKVDPAVKSLTGHCSRAPHRISHTVRLPLPQESRDGFHSLLFAFPPNQDYEYYRLAQRSDETIVGLAKPTLQPIPVMPAVALSASSKCEDAIGKAM